MPNTTLASPSRPAWRPPAALDDAAVRWPRRALLFSLLALLLGLLIQPVADPDVYIHLRDGRYWVESGLQVDQEPFAFTVPEAGFEKTEWLFRVGIYLAWQLGGPTLVILLKSLLIAAALYLLGVLVYRRWPNLGVVGLLLGLAVLAPATRLFPERPYVFTYLFLPLALLLLDRFRRGEPATRNLWWLVPLTALWSNLHPGFLALFGFLGAQLAEDALVWWQGRDSEARARTLTLAAVSAAAAGAGMLNFQGPGVYDFVLSTMGTEDFMKFLVEWQPPALAEQPFFFLLLAAAWMAVLLDYRKVRLHELLPLLACSYLGLKSYRNIPLFLIAGLPVLALHARHWVERSFPHRPWTLFARKTGLWLAAGLGLVLLTIAGATGFSLRGGEVKGFFPGPALHWILQQPWQGRILSHDIWGGYIGWKTHGRIKVFMDGRMPTFGPALYADYRKMIWGDPEACLALLDRYQIQGILVSPKNELRLYQQLWKSGQWALIYWDDVCALYARRGGPNQGLIDHLEFRYVDPKRSPYFHPSHPDLALGEIERARRMAPDSFLPPFLQGEMYMRRGQPEKAQEAFQRTLELAPQHVGAFYNLASIAQEAGQPDRSEWYYRAILKWVGPGEIRAKVLYQLAAMLKADPARKPEALRLAGQAQRMLPAWEPARQLLDTLQKE